jgi:hypothetical protein
MTKPKDVVGGFDASHCSPASLLSMCSRSGIENPCPECGNHTPVKMNQGRRFWIRCFMCQHDGPSGYSMKTAIKKWEKEIPKNCGHSS